jgi:Zn-dependent protease with chaperone function
MVLAIGLGVGMILLGIGVLAFMFSGLGILLGIALIMSGGILLWFMVQAFFILKKDNRDGLLEIQLAEDPQLFKFVREVTEETGTPFPKRVYLSAEVNAAVFFESTWLSLFFPVKKNLVIGLGLVNALSAGEFKAVVAHEFGHFSQKSMRVGSYVYQVNSIIHRLLYDNSGVAPFLARVANWHWAFAIAAQIAVWFIKGIQKAVVALHGVVNLPYMRLSREMEFHADGIAASVAGGDQLARALYRTQMVDQVYGFTIAKMNSLLADKKRIANLYPHQSMLVRHVAEEWKLPFEQGWPVITREWQLRFQNTRVDASRQWESHPRTMEREEHVLKLGYQRPLDNRSAWDLFSQPEKWQLRLTQMLYEAVPEASQWPELDALSFGQRLINQRSAFIMPAYFQDYFSDRRVAAFTATDEYDPPVEQWQGSPEQLFGHPFHDWPRLLAGLEADIHLCTEIKAPQTNLRYFEFEGRKRKIKEADEVMRQLAAEQEDLLRKLKAHDRLVVKVALEKGALAGREGEVRAALKSMAEADTRWEREYNLLHRIQEVWRPLYEQQLDESLVKHMVNAFRGHEHILFQTVQQYLDDRPLEWGVGEDVLINLNQFPKATKVFVKDGQFNSELYQQLMGTLSALGLLMDWRRAKAYQVGLGALQQVLQANS